VEELVKHPRLPVWPAWFGIFYILLDLITGRPDWGAKLEDMFGGRVCPMIFDNTRASDPFLLVAHHRHSFNVFDPFRYIFRSVLMPEGFPAHPHRGFETVTYVLRGGLVHRDSFGIKKSYGAPPSADGSGEGGAVQWMTAGRGLMHEEMWRTGSATDNSDQELFQIWVNLPSRAKMVQPRMQLLGASEGQGRSSFAEVRELGPVPHVEPSPGVIVRVIAGSADGVASPVDTFSEMAILHVTLAAGAEWRWPRAIGWTCIIYTRRGDVEVAGRTVPVHSTVRLDRESEVVMLKGGPEGGDILLLAGAPLGEPIEMGANIVMNSRQELAQASTDMRFGAFGPVWEHTEDDESWIGRVSAHWGQLGLGVRLGF